MKLSSQDYGARLFFPLQPRWFFFSTWWIFKRHAAICKTNHHRVRIIKVMMYLYFSYLGTCIIWDYKVHFFPSTIPKRASQEATVEKLGCTHLHYKAQRTNMSTKTTQIQQEGRAFLHTSWTSQECKDYFTFHTFTHNIRKVFS